MAKNSRVNTDNLFKSIISPIEQTAAEQGTTEQGEVQNHAPARVGRKPDKEKKIQVSIYLTPEQAKTLRIQNAEKVKEADKSAIARVGIDIVLAMSDEEYLYMKEEAKKQGKEPGDILKEALALYKNR